MMESLVNSASEARQRTLMDEDERAMNPGLLASDPRDRLQAGRMVAMYEMLGEGPAGNQALRLRSWVWLQLATARSKWRSCRLQAQP